MEDDIDREVKELVAAVGVKFKASSDAVLAISAFGVTLDAEKLPVGMERRKVVAGAVIALMQALPSVWGSIAEANDDLGPVERYAMVQRIMEVLFDVELGPPVLVKVEP